jgi:hypothetical protein
MQDNFNNIAIFLAILVVFMFGFVLKKNSSKKIKRRLSGKHEIDNYVFPDSIRDKLIQKYPHLSQADTTLVLEGLKEWFHVCNVVGKKAVSMPSQVVDDAWHEFILFTKKYNDFCLKALGRFLHHTPAEAMSSPQKAQVGIKRAWRVSCKRARINAYSPRKMPILFSLDKKLKIPNGFIYSRDCKGPRSSGFCAVHISCTSCNSGCAGQLALSGDANTSGDSWFSSCSNSSSCGSGCGGGD